MENLFNEKNLDMRFIFSVFDSFLIEVPESFTEVEAKDMLKYLSEIDIFKFNPRFAFATNWRQAQDLT